MPRQTRCKYKAMEQRRVFVLVFLCCSLAVEWNDLTFFKRRVFCFAVFSSVFSAYYTIEYRILKANLIRKYAEFVMVSAFNLCTRLDSTLLDIRSVKIIGIILVREWDAQESSWSASEWKFFLRSSSVACVRRYLKILRFFIIKFWHR